MSKNKNNIFGRMDNIAKSAGLKDTRNKKAGKGTTNVSENESDEPVMMYKQISIDRSWKNAIKSYYSGTLTSYIVLAVREKMKRDGIL